MTEFKEIRELYDFMDTELDIRPEKSEVRELFNCWDVAQAVHVYLDGTDWYVIHEDVIDDEHEHVIKEIVQDCYLDGTDLDKYWWIAIDWEQTAKNCKEADGYGHTFASYDGVEYYHEGWYWFRTN